MTGTKASWIPNPNACRSRSTIGRIIIIVCSLAILFAASPAISCIFPMPLHDSTMDRADTVFRGRISAYEAHPDDSPYIRLIFEVEETYLGPAASRHVVPWYFGDYRTQDIQVFFGEAFEDAFEEAFGDDLLVGLAPSDRAGPTSLAAQRRLPEGSELLGLRWVVDELCAPAFMFEYALLQPWLQRQGYVD